MLRRFFSTLLISVVVIDVGWMALAVADDANLPSYKTLECESSCGTWTRPVLIDHYAQYPKSDAVPRAPLEQAAYDGEALVTIRLTVTADGRVADPVIEHRLGPAAFAKDAIRTVSNWRYTPATRNGVPVQHANQLVHLQYRFDPPAKELGDRVFEAYRDARSLMNEGKLEEADQKLRMILLLPRLNLYEWTMTSLLLAYCDIARKDYAEAANHIDDATVWQGSYLDRKALEQALRLAIEIDGATGQWGDALDAFQVLKIQFNIGANDPDSKVIDAIHAKLDGSAPANVFGVISSGEDSEVWRHTLLRRTFGFGQADANVDRFELRCDQQEIASAVSTKAEWHVPKDWSHCILDVFGKAGARFQLLEYNN